MTIAIQDANILIDLIRANAMDHCMQLEYSFITTSLVILEIDDPHQQAILQPFIDNGSLEVIDLTEEELETAQQLENENRKLSLQDISVYLVAEKKKAILLSGDNILRRFAQEKGLTVCGHIWLLDEMIAGDIITMTQAADLLQIFLDNKCRLPDKECKERFERWKLE